ncbi:MAG TPA: hypothetical protein VNH18_16500 [Bryobacteraceae bacterium]|nr:hypothetical protein [Bryobacteraceae bacterium]
MTSVLQKRSWLRVVAVSAVAISLMTGSSCEQADQPRPTDEMVMRAFDMCPKSEPPPGGLPRVELWLDDSLSMAGYVNVPSAYEKVLRRVIQGSVQAGYTTSIRGFSSNATVPLESLSAVLSPTYYKDADTRLAAVLDQASQPKEKGEKDKIVVLVSDLVQDEKSRDALAVASALRKVAGRFPNAILYGFRSAFRGTYYIASRARGKFAVDTLDGIGRPFYVLVLAPSTQDLRQFQRFGGLHELIGEKTFAGKTFEPSLAPVSVESVHLNSDSDPDKNDFDPDGVSDWRCTNGRWSQIHVLRVTRRAKAEMRLSFALHATPLLPVVMPSRYQTDVRKLSSDFRQAGPAPDAAVTAEGDLAEASATLTYRFPKPADGHWEVYSVRMRAGDANLSRPRWMTDWSTEDDSLPDTRDRTLNLAGFGDALVRAIAERANFLDHVVELYGGGN